MARNVWSRVDRPLRVESSCVTKLGVADVVLVALDGEAIEGLSSMAVSTAFLRMLWTVRETSRCS